MKTPLSQIRAAHPLDRAAVATAIAIPPVVVQALGHGHAGAAMDMAPLAHALFSSVLRHDPADPAWAGRDRFILSAGHASLLLYTQLYLTGYGLTLDDLAHTRTPGYPTPGHPERGRTPGVEMTTGPLGQGVAGAVGLALAARREETLFGRRSRLFDPTVWVLAGDGCLAEGVSAEASSLAGAQRLDNLVLIWDDNRIMIDGTTSEANASDVRARYRAYGWRVLDVPDHLDVDDITGRLHDATERTGRPTLLAVRSVIGWPSPAHQRRPSAHAGAFGEADVAAILQGLGFPADATLADLVRDDVLAHCRRALVRGAELHADWDDRLSSWRVVHPAPARARHRAWRGPDPAEIDAALASVPVGTPAPTRATSGAVLAALTPSGRLWGGSADLPASTNTVVLGTLASAEDPGATLRFGVREHAMAGILSGIALHGLWRPYGSGYLTFSDYARGAIRLAALMGLPVVYIFTHDSVAVGEDGPTYQPVEQVASLRLVPGLDVIRPADARETVACWRRLLKQPERPAALILSHQMLPVLPDAPDEDVQCGGYVTWSAGRDPDPLLLIATGSEVALALDAGHILAGRGRSVRVVSLPCVTWFEEQPAAYRDTVLPPTARRRIVIEAGRTTGWWRYAGLEGAVVGVDGFGASAPGPDVLAAHGVTVEHVVAVAESLGRPT